MNENIFDAILEIKNAAVVASSAGVGVVVVVASAAVVVAAAIVVVFNDDNADVVVVFAAVVVDVVAAATTVDVVANKENRSAPDAVMLFLDSNFNQSSIAGFQICSFSPSSAGSSTNS